MKKSESTNWTKSSEFITIIDPPKKKKDTYPTKNLWDEIFKRDKKGG